MSHWILLLKHLHNFVINGYCLAGLIRIFCAYERRSEKNVHVEKVEYNNRWSYTDMDEKCLQKFDVWRSPLAKINEPFCLDGQ